MQPDTEGPRPMLKRKHGKIDGVEPRNFPDAANVVFTVEVRPSDALCAGVIRAPGFELEYGFCRRPNKAVLRVKWGLWKPLLEHIRAQKATSVTVKPDTALHGMESSFLAALGPMSGLKVTICDPP